MLQTSACVQLSKTQANDFLSEKKPLSEVDRPAFLCRAVNATWHDTNGFEIHTSDNGDLWIDAAALSRRIVPIERRAVVVWLDRPPQDVYVTFGVYE